MISEYAIVPSAINSKQMKKTLLSFSPSNYYELKIKNRNTRQLKELVLHPIKGGKEVGSKEYLPHSTKFFIRTRCLTGDSLLLDYESDGLTPIRPQAFITQELSAGDVLISKDSNIGEAAILERDLNDFMVSGGIKILKIQNMPYYVYAFLKHKFFKEQLALLISRGATLKHAKDRYLDCKIPFPTQKNSDDVMEFVSLLVRSIMRKESRIIENNREIHRLISKELRENPSDKKFSYSYPTSKEIEKHNRLDTGLYTEDYKRKMSLIDNYRNGADDIEAFGFDLSRGQNLQITNIGKSIYADDAKEGYYKLFLPTHLTHFGTVSKTIYLGNKNKLRCLENGDIVFGAEGFEKGRSIVITEDISHTITNIHGIILKSRDHDLTKSIFVRCFLNYLRDEGLIDKYAVGGNGGSLSIKYWDAIKFPRFSPAKQAEIRRYYHNEVVNSYSGLDLSSFEREDVRITDVSGIIQLDTQIKVIQNKLNDVLDKVVRDETVQIDFDF